MDASRVGELRRFVEACRKDPALLADSSLAFFRDYLTSLGADLPAAASAAASAAKVSKIEEDGLEMRDPTLEPDELDEDVVESDLELEGDVVQLDHGDTPQKMGDTSVEVTEESRDASRKAKCMAMEAMSVGNLEEAADHLTNAILLNPISAIVYSIRASVFIKMKKPAAAICDANAALEINCNYAKAYKARGMANAMLGKWEEAARDLYAASNIDYDDEISAVLKKVEPNVYKIVEHRRKYDRLRKERKEKKAEHDRLCRRAEAQAAYEKAKRNDQSSSGYSDVASYMGFPGGMPVGLPSDYLGIAKRLLCSTEPADHVSKVLDTPLDDNNLLGEIMLRLPLQPSSLPRASLVCKRWFHFLIDEKFTECYRKHHQKAPLLGFFTGFTTSDVNFFPFRDKEPNSISISPERFSVPMSSRWAFLGCRHGLAVLLNIELREVVVWDPITGQRKYVSFPPVLQAEEFDEFDEYVLWQWHTAVLCVDAEEGHVHGDCFSSPFKLVLILNGETRTSACLYDSASGVWGDAVSTVARDTIDPPTPSILSGNALYWLFQGGDILVFDLERQTLGVIKKPAGNPYAPEQSVRMLRTDNGRGLGLAVLLRSCIQLWKRISNSDGLAEWELLQRTFQLEMLFPRAMNTGLVTTSLVGYDEDSNEIVLATCIGLFMVEVDSMLSRAISESKLCSICYPYRNFFTAGRGVGWKRNVLDI